MPKESTIWGIHAGRTGDADSLFLEMNVIALGWDKMGDLTQLPNDREAYKARVAAVFPNKKPAAIPGTAGRLICFVPQMQNGCLIFFPPKQRPHDHHRPI